MPEYALLDTPAVPSTTSDRPAGGMDRLLAVRVSNLVDFGWRVTSQTPSSVAIETRTPLNWGVLALAVLLFFGAGGLVYTGYWLLTSRQHVFMVADQGRMFASGDVWLIERQESDRVTALLWTNEVRQREFWSVAWRSLAALALSVAAWGALATVIVRLLA